MISRRKFTVLAGSAALCAATQPACAAARVASTKRGCCFTTGRNGRWRKRIDSLQPSWMYSWGNRHPDGLPTSVEFTPMIWHGGKAEVRERKITDLTKRFAAGQVKHVLGFNEPDQPKQSNMIVERAIDLWPELMSIGAPLVSPGCVHPDRDWMNDFMDQVEKRDLRVDAIAVHSYAAPNANHLANRLEKAYQRFGRPIWLTEFAVGDWEAKKPEENRYSAKRVEAFMRDVLPALDELDFVERYAWFSGSPTSGPLGTSALFNADGELTPLGHIYAEH